MAVEYLRYGIATDVKITWKAGWCVTVLRPAFKSIMPWVYVRKRFWLRMPEFIVERINEENLLESKK